MHASCEEDDADVLLMLPTVCTGAQAGYQADNHDKDQNRHKGWHYVHSKVASPLSPEQFLEHGGLRDGCCTGALLLEIGVELRTDTSAAREGSALDCKASGEVVDAIVDATERIGTAWTVDAFCCLLFLEIRTARTSRR